MRKYLILFCSKTTNFIRLTLWDIIYFSSFCIPKKKYLWVFGAWFGEKFSDNSKYLFRYVHTHYPHIRVVWLTKNKETFIHVTNEGFECYLIPSVKGIMIALQAKVGIVSTGLSDICEYATGNTKIVQLWHGTPLKKIMNDDTLAFKNISIYQKFIRIIFPFLNSKYTNSLLISPSKTVSKTLSTAFIVPESKIKITGYPRNDAFFMPLDKTIPIAPRLLHEKKQNKKIGIYMPTHRKQGATDIYTLFSSSLSSINDRLKSLQVILLVKFHFYHYNNLSDNELTFSNILFIKDEDIHQDVYSLLPYTDFLITDYSSIYFDYLLTNKPILFAPFDKEEYISTDRALYYRYDKVTPGAKAKNWEELLNNIDEYIHNPNTFASERSSIRTKFNTYCDDNSSSRVCDEIFKLIDG